MGRTVKRMEFQAVPQVQVTRVAAYARVSSGKDAMLHSLSAQVSYYSRLIQNHPGWIYCGVYSDEAVSGTKYNREGFQKLLADCRDGKVDMIITKSISRLARNTVVLLETVRELKNLGVDIYFEEQHIHSISSDGELLLAILASYAEEESRSVSENQRWRIKKYFEMGRPWVGFMLGYRLRNGQYEVVPEEAATVRRIFDSYLSGMGYLAICKELNDAGLTTRDGLPWKVGTLMSVLRNYCYTGNLVLQRTFRKNHLTKRPVPNRGERPMYHAVGAHEPIISLELFNAVQEERFRRAEKYSRESEHIGVYPFTRKVFCGGCGASFNRKTARGKKIWICRTYNRLGKAACASSKAVPEESLCNAAAQALGFETFEPEAFEDAIERIIVQEGNLLVFCFRDGTQKTVEWADISRAESWSSEMKAAAREVTMKRQRRGRTK